MMTPEQIAAMRADAEAGTPGPWTLVEENGEFYYWHILDATGDDFMGDKAYYPWQSRNESDRKRFQRVPDMEATIIAQAAEIARLTEMLTVQWEGIPWRDGPPPVEWRDGRDVAVCEASDECTIYNFVTRKDGEKVWIGGVGTLFADDGWWFTHDGHGILDAEITHHAAVTLPEVK